MDADDDDDDIQMISLKLTYFVHKQRINQLQDGLQIIWGPPIAWPQVDNFI